MNNEKINTKLRIQKLLKLLESGIYEKQKETRLLLLAAIAGENAFMIGNPGSAKSLLARRIASAFITGDESSLKYFETLLNRHTTPEELFGNISLKALNGELENDKGEKKEEYRHLTEGKLPEADFAFLDEIFKAGPAILNTLLTIINEHIFHNGSNIMKVPLKSVITASNEFPEEDSGLAALYDRLLVRIPVKNIQDENTFMEMIDQSADTSFKVSEEEKKLLITSKDLEKWRGEIDKVKLSPEAKKIISSIRKELDIRNEKMSEADKAAGETFEISDRRWKHIVHLLKTSAYLCDRDEVDIMDCSLCEYCLWGTEKQYKIACEVVKKVIAENGADCDSALEDIDEQIDAFTKKVQEEWCEEVDVIEKIDCYEFIKCKKGNEFFYIEKTDNNYKSVYDATNRYCGHNSLYRKGNEFTDGSVNTTPYIIQTKTRLRKKSDINHETLQKKFNKQYYNPVKACIEAEIKRLKAVEKEGLEKFRENIFADQAYYDQLASKLHKTIQLCEDRKVKLDKQAAVYYKKDLDAKVNPGDVITDDGSVYTRNEIKNMKDKQKESVVGVVCIADKKTYIVGLNQGQENWSANFAFAASYGAEFSKPYNTGWKVPDKNQLGEIFKNLDTVNDSINKVNGTTFEDKEYWSSTENDEKTGAFYQEFSRDGETDCTLKNHNYSVCVIHEWVK